MAKSGQARVLSPAHKVRLFAEIAKRRHPEKNAAIMHISFHLGLRAQEIALLRIKEVARLTDRHGGFELHEILALPAAFTKGANATNRSKSEYQRKSVTLSVARFDQVVMEVARLAEAGGKIEPENYYPPVRKHSGVSRDLPMRHEGLRTALEEYLKVRLQKSSAIRQTDPLFITQKGGPYSPNTLQEHMALMLRGWAGIEKASSHSGRRTVGTHIIEKQNKSIKVAQKILGHKNASTTAIYDEPSEETLGDALSNLDD